MSTDKLQDNISLIKETILESAKGVGRDPSLIQLHAATKAVDASRIIKSMEYGLTDFGENWIQEANPKIATIKESLLGNSSRPNWHMIGHLQSNKVKEAVELFNSIDTVDSLRLAKSIDRRSGENQKKMQISLELDFTDDEKRNGFRLGNENDLERHQKFISEIDQISSLENIELVGIMTVAPIGTTPEDARPYFRKASQILDELQELFPDQPLNQLSMGMTLDYHIAIQEGATIVRLGTAIFGERSPGRTY